MALGRKTLAALMTAGLMALGGCADGYGYSGVSVGSGYGGYGPGYYGGGYGYAPSYYGWYNDYYYPGTGVYVYDRWRRPYPWNDGQRAYWEGRRDAWRGGPMRDQWRGWGRGGWRGGPGGWRGGAPGGAPGGWHGNGGVRPTPPMPPRGGGWHGGGRPGGRGGPRGPR